MYEALIGSLHLEYEQKTNIIKVRFLVLERIAYYPQLIKACAF